MSPVYLFSSAWLYSVLGLIFFMFLFWHFLAPVWFGIFFKFETGFCCLARGWAPWVPEVFLACEEELRRPQADTYSAEGRRHERQLKT